MSFTFGIPNFPFGESFFVSVRGRGSELILEVR